MKWPLGLAHVHEKIAFRPRTRRDPGTAPIGPDTEEGVNPTPRVVKHVPAPHVWADMLADNKSRYTPGKRE